MTCHHVPFDCSFSAPHRKPPVVCGDDAAPLIYLSCSTHGGSASEAVRVKNNWISPGHKWRDFIHSLSSNWLLHVDFLTCLPINVQLFMCLINDRCSFIKPLNYIWNWKATAAQALLHLWGCQGDINHLNGIQQERFSPLDWIGLFVILLSFCFCGDSTFSLDLKSTLNRHDCQRSLCRSDPVCFVLGFLFIFLLFSLLIVLLCVWSVASRIQHVHFFCFVFVYKQ